MFSSCCMCDPRKEEAYELTVDGQASDQEDAPATITTLQPPLTVEQKAVGKQRVFSLVMIFIRAALSRKLPCVYIDQVSNEKRENAFYMMDKPLQRLITEVDGARRPVNFNNLMELYLYRDLNSVPKLYSYLRLPVICYLTEEEKRRLVIIEHIDGSRCLRRLCLLVNPITPQGEVSPEDEELYLRHFCAEEIANTFCQCLRVFRFYAQNGDNVARAAADSTTSNGVTTSSASSGA